MYRLTLQLHRKLHVAEFFVKSLCYQLQYRKIRGDNFRQLKVEESISVSISHFLDRLAFLHAKRAM